VASEPTEGKPESFGISADVAHVAWCFVGRTGRAKHVPDHLVEPVRRAILLAIFQLELSEPRTKSQHLARDLSASALLDAYERLTGESPVTRWDEAVFHKAMNDLPRDTFEELLSKVHLSATIAKSTCGEVYAGGQTALWDLMTVDGQKRLVVRPAEAA
jgi:hypothetical protein